MKYLICNWLSIWYTLHYPREGLLVGMFLSGHDFEGTGNVHADHWEIRCTRCGLHAGSEVIPPEAKK